MHAMHDPWPLGKKCLPPKGGKNSLGKFCPGGPLATLSSTIEHRVRNFFALFVLFYCAIFLSPYTNSMIKNNFEAHKNAALD